MNEQEAEQIKRLKDSMPYTDFILLGLRALSAHSARWATLAIAAALFGGTLWKPSWLRLATAATFTVLVNLPLWWRRDK